MKRLVLIAALALAACGGDPGPGAIDVNADPVALHPDAPDRTDLGSLTWRGGLVLTSDDERFGGLSAIEVYEDGFFIAVSDSAYWITGTMTFDEDGTLTGLEDVSLAPMLSALGGPLTGTAADAEGLADLGGGRFAVSFEREHRIEIYDIGERGERMATALPENFGGPPGIERLRNNGGVEALATVPGGLMAFIEYPIIDGRPHTIWHLPDGGAPEAHDFHAEAGFGLTGADVLPDGSILLLERFWSRDIGNRIRVAQTDEARLTAGEPATILAAWGTESTIDNLEGLAVAEVNGETRLFLLSDNNYSGEQRSLLLSFTIEGY
ncbi:esterase-like activity of phytase family protein [Hyphobacterium marinum]|uniref:Esterase-like activity of phytase family protein n=1 Tax=Hyphobacterium marinum TaxID=3116574 RepID=A0ABU7LYB8_9PROT|nr:esterase-like activity of phytase family protein [Hyphobacterium sp. Y6023]MEE2566267.1 esterase-like activity of phytase family protein [Hyphobacterium sp. Y6023]